MKVKILAAGTLLVLSASLTACGGTTTTPTVGPTSTTGASMSTSPTGGAMESTPMMSTSPTAMMGATAMVSQSSTEAMMGKTPTGGMMESTPMMSASPGAATPGQGGLKRKIVVSSKAFTEAALLGEMYALVLEQAGVGVERKLNLGTETVAQAALVKGGGADGIDLYPEYTSTGLTTILKKDPIYDPKQVYNTIKQEYESQFKITWLDTSPMNDTQALVTTKANSDKFGIKSLDDLCAKAGQVTLAAVAEFKDRPDALPLLQKTYGGCQFKEIKIFEPNLRYQALLNGQVDIAQAFSTDGQIAGNGLVLLADPKNYGLPYNVAPVVRDDVLAMYPQIADTLNKLSPKITNDVISALNWEVDGKKREVADVAKEWLMKEGLLK